MRTVKRFADGDGILIVEMHPEHSTTAHRIRPDGSREQLLGLDAKREEGNTLTPVQES